MKTPDSYKTAQQRSFVKRTITALVGAALLAATPLVADTDVVELEPYAVDGQSDASQNPLTRVPDGLFGGERTLLETPRGISLITSAALHARGIGTVAELAAFAPSAYAPSRFGSQTTPNVRGDTAEAYRNGQRLSANLFGMPLSFNGVEAAEIVRGPASVVQGAGFYNGGYVNYVTKQADTQATHTQITARIGSWLPDGGSYLNTEWQIDHNQPLVNGKSALRVSYLGRENDTFYHTNGGRDDAQELFASHLWTPHEGIRWELNAEWQWQAAPQLLGVNRPSQELIDTGRYYTGTPVDQGGYFMGPWLIPSAGTATLSRDSVLLSTGDYSNANRLMLQSNLTVELSPQSELTNRTLFEHVNRRRYHDFEYAEFVEQTSIENRTEYSTRYQLFGLDQQTTLGLSLRFEDREALVNYFNEYFFAFDLTMPPPYNFSQQYPLSYYPGRAGPRGVPFFGVEDGSPETAASQLFTPSIFWLQSTQLSSQWELITGIRSDTHFAEAEDAMPLPNTAPVGDSLTYSTYSAHASLRYQPSEQQSYYLTLSRTHAVNGSVSGGTLLLFSDSAGGAFLARDDFRNRSDLIELGGRYALAKDTLYAGWTAYHQTRARTEVRGGKSDLELQGLEWEITWTPEKAYYFTANLTYTDGKYVDSAPFQLGGRSLYDAYPLGEGPGGLGTGNGYDPFGNQVPVGDYRIPGLSRWTANIGAGWRAHQDHGPRADFWASWQSSQYGNLDGEYVIPSQYTLNLSVAWRFSLANMRSIEIGARCLNLTDETNWVHNGDTFMNNQVLLRELPRRLDFFVIARF